MRVRSRPGDPRPRKTPRKTWTARRLAWPAAGVCLVVTALLTWLLWPSSAEPRPRAYRDVTACLLTAVTE